MTEHSSSDPGVRDGFVQLDEGDMHVVESGRSDSPAVLMIHGTMASTVYWDTVVPALVRDFRVIRVDLLGSGRSTTPARGYDIPTQARRISTALDRLGVNRVTVIGHSSGGAIAVALAEQRPDAVMAVALIGTGPSLDTEVPESRLAHLVLTPVIGPLLWRLRTKDAIRKASQSGFTRPVEIPDAMIEHILAIEHRTFVGMMTEPLSYFRERSLADRLAALGLPLLVIFGAEDKRWLPAPSIAAYRSVPGARVEVLAGVGHTPMMEDPQVTGRLLRDFAEAVELRT